MDFGELGKKVGERWGALTAEEKKVRRTHAPPPTLAAWCGAPNTGGPAV
jgi:hypothetical protein